MPLPRLPYWTRYDVAQAEAEITSWSAPVPGPVVMHCLLLRGATMTADAVGRAAWARVQDMWPEDWAEYTHPRLGQVRVAFERRSGLERSEPQRACEGGRND